MSRDFPYREIAVFYRVQKQAEILEKVFERAELPYVLPTKQKEDEDSVPERPHMIREYVAEGKLNAVSGEHTMEKSGRYRTTDGGRRRSSSYDTARLKRSGI